MAERPMLMSAPMVRALLAGTKTQTRRQVASPRTRPSFVVLDHGQGWWPYQSDDGESELCDDGMEHPYVSPYGKPGDRLWVREAWKAHPMFDHLPPRDIPESHIWYMADDGYKAESRYRHARFMPRWASRILLEVTAVRVEQLQEISEADAKAEGAECLFSPTCSAADRELLDIPLMEDASPFRNGYALLWESINGPDSWDANPWVWVVEFKRVTT
jgi:hypothetical protein